MFFDNSVSFGVGKASGGMRVHVGVANGAQFVRLFTGAAISPDMTTLAYYPALDGPVTRSLLPAPFDGANGGQFVRLFTGAASAPDMTTLAYYPGLEGPPTRSLLPAPFDGANGAQFVRLFTGAASAPDMTTLLYYPGLDGPVTRSLLPAPSDSPRQTIVTLPFRTAPNTSTPGPDTGPNPPAGMPANMADQMAAVGQMAGSMVFLNPPPPRGRRRDPVDELIESGARWMDRPAREQWISEAPGALVQSAGVGLTVFTGLGGPAAIGLGRLGCMGLSGAGNGAITAGQNMQAGESPFSPSTFISAALGFLFGSCFTGDMLVDVEGGKKRADQIAVGDRLWARSEFDPSGPIELKEVEEVFVRVAPIMNLHVAGQIIRTTREHPFYVESRGWIPAAMLEIGDLLVTRYGAFVPVEGVADSGEVTTVYNWRIADYHTYFVSARLGASPLWAHNAGYGNALTSAQPATLYRLVHVASGAVVKWGMTNNILRRYPQSYLNRIGAELQPIITGLRDKIAAIERELVRQIPGPINNEPWAGALLPR